MLCGIYYVGLWAGRHELKRMVWDGEFMISEVGLLAVLQIL